MNNEIVTYDTGEELFKDNNSIYINYVNESVESHLHAHKFLEISYVASGYGLHFMDHKEYSVGKGDLFLINHDISHEFRSLSVSSPLMVYNCVFKPDFIDKILNEYKDFTDVIHYLSFRSLLPMEAENIDDIKLLGVENNEIETIYKKMLTEYTLKEDGYIQLLKLYLNELLIVIFRVLKKSSKKKDSMINRNGKLIETAIAYLKDNYSLNSKLNDLATMSFFSPTYFCKLFKEYTGITLSEYIQKLRIEEACIQLKNTDKKTIIIANEVGYKDIKYFNQIFKKTMGISPSIYRKH